MKKEEATSKQKREAVERILSGSLPDAEAQELGISTERMEKLVNHYVKAGKRGLRYTRDPGEKPRLADVEFMRQNGFPAALFTDCDTAACFFCAEFFGKTELVHLSLLGLPEVTMVDIDSDKLEHMAKIYPDSWEIFHCDAFEAAQRFREESRTFDLVTCDAYESERVAFDCFEEFASLATRFLVMNFRQRMFEELGVTGHEPEPSEVHRGMQARGIDVNVMSLHKRSSHDGGIYWVVFQR